MAVKTFINGQSKTITSGFNMPFTFINGEKKRLIKGITFINGVKKVLWDNAGVSYDLITATDSGGSNWFLEAVGEKWLFGSQLSSSGNALLWDITNISSPNLKQSVAWGSGWQINTYQSTNEQYVFYNRNGSTLKKMTIVPSTGVMTVAETYNSASSNSLLTKTDQWVQYTVLRKNWTQPTVVSVQYGNTFYFNGVQKYQIGSAPSSATDKTYVYRYITSGTKGVQVDATGIIANVTSRDSSKAGLHIIRSSGITRIANAIANPVMWHDNKVVGIEAGRISGVSTSVNIKLAIYETGAYAELASYQTEGNKAFHFLGKNGAYYYIIQYDALDTSAIPTLILLNEEDLSIAYEKELPIDPFNEYDGLNTFYAAGTYVGGTEFVSYTGYVAFKGNTTTTGGVGKIIRFGQFL